MKQFLGGVLESAGLCAAAAFLFYRSVWALVPAVVVIPIYLRRKALRLARQRCMELEQQFEATLVVVAGGLSAGYSLENAWKLAERELEAMYGAEADMVRELQRMNGQVRMNMPLEQLIVHFAVRSGSEDIINFAEVFQYGKRSGGNMTEMIQNVVERIREKREILDDIATQIAAKKFEQKMICMIFPGILFFITLTSGEYMSVLYHNAVGITVMTICLGGYIGAILWAEKIMDIRV